jgi:8-oxo-dGTP diphosphatase
VKHLFSSEWDSMRARRTARIYLFDPGERVLLIRFVVQRSDGPFEFWLTPGGEVEGDETPVHAAARELREELGLTVPVGGPVYIERNQFEHQGEMRDNTDFFFVARCGAVDPWLIGLTPEEIAVMREVRWWSAEEIADAQATGSRFFPVDIVVRVRA